MLNFLYFIEGPKNLSKLEKSIKEDRENVIKLVKEKVKEG